MNFLIIPSILQFLKIKDQNSMTNSTSDYLLASGDLKKIGKLNYFIVVDSLIKINLIFKKKKQQKSI